MPWGEDVPITDEMVRKGTSGQGGPLTCGMVA